MNPLVSIVIPVYNGADFLQEAIDSALAQSYPNVEVIVVNDGSNDDGATEQIALSYGEKIRYFSKPNGGVATALNTAIAEMKGDYFSWLSHDDLYLPEKLETQVRFLLRQEMPEKTVIYSDFATFSENPNKCREIRYPSVASENFRYFLACGESIHGCALLVPRAALLHCGMFNEKLRTTQDYDMWFRLTSFCQFVHVDQVLVKARQHGAQGTQQMRPTVLAECNELLMRFIADINCEEAVRATGLPAAMAYAQTALSYSRQGFNRAASVASKLALQNMGDAKLGEAGSSLLLLLKATVVRARAVLRGYRQRIGRGV